KSANSEPGDYSAHRLLADTYSTQPRHQIARINELYQSQLLQPLNVTPIPPQLAEPNLFIMDTAGPMDLAFNEFGPMFDSKRLSVHGAAVGGGNGTSGETISVSGIRDRIGYSVGHFHFETDGFRINNDLEN